ncbi:MAG: hypothetical protein ACJ74Q_24420 [Pyrinomonadaceae bacterium]
MKKILSLALSFTVSSLGLVALAAKPVRARQVASVGGSINKIKEEYERLLAVDRDPSTEPDVREVNRKFLEERRAQLRTAIETRIGALRKYQASMNGTLSPAEGLVVANSIQALERDLSALAGEQNSSRSTTKAAPRPRLVSDRHSAEAKEANAAVAVPPPSAATAAAASAEPQVPTITLDWTDNEVNDPDVSIPYEVNDPSVQIEKLSYTVEGPSPLKRVDVLPTLTRQNAKGIVRVVKDEFPVTLYEGYNIVTLSDTGKSGATASVKIRYKKKPPPPPTDETAPDTDTDTHTHTGTHTGTDKPKPIKLGGEYKDLEGLLKIKTSDKVGKTLKLTVTAPNPDDKTKTVSVVERPLTLDRKVNEYTEKITLGEGENTITVTDAADSTLTDSIKWVGVKPAAQPESAANVAEQAPEYDWGRVRAYFSGGVVLSKERGNFSKNDIFLDFTLDKNYLAPRSWKVLHDVNSFFDARLTSIPVSQPTGSSSSSTPCTTNTPDCENFLTSEKGALLQAGFYFPIYGKYTSWMRSIPSEETTRVDKRSGTATIERSTRLERNALFVAPLLKGGIQTITGNRTTAEGTRFGGDDVFNFFSFGGMLGHFRIPTQRELCKKKSDDDGRGRGRSNGQNNEQIRISMGGVRGGDGADQYDEDCYLDGDGNYYKYTRNTNLAPELISWLTVSAGRWESFDIMSPTQDRDPNGQTIFVRERPWRWEALGRMKIPNTPFIIGFDGNFGKGPDDLRFLFGTRFDIGKLFTALKVGQAAKRADETAPAPNSPAPTPKAPAPTQ